ncbi:hypothetical protein, partial [Aureivirga marina]|uniref:hypothetical protein n=1 Tax=Aureivirga marina TaxID=1182451 RepID=UPI0018C90E0E
MNTFRKSFVLKVLSVYMAMSILFQDVLYRKAFALTGGPGQPEFASFTPIGTSDMVNLSSGDFNYNIPVMDVGGYPLNLAYQSGISMDQEASWVGLGWNLNVGQINRQVRGLPDDFKGDKIETENYLKPNVTVGAIADLNLQLLGFELGNKNQSTSGSGSGGSGGSGNSGVQEADSLHVNLKLGIIAEYNNYKGISFKPTLGTALGLSYDISTKTSVGMDLTSSSTEGVTVASNISQSFSGVQTRNLNFEKNGVAGGSVGFGVRLNSRQGLISTNLSASLERRKGNKKRPFNGGNKDGAYGSISFIDNTYTPSKRTAFKTNAVTFSASTGVSVAGIDGELGLSGYGTVQTIKNERQVTAAYGYDYSKDAGSNDLLDFNRENEKVITPDINVMPVTNQTYDIYSIQGQGIGGTFRPFKGQVNFVRDPKVQDESISQEFGGEFEAGFGAHMGYDYRISVNESTTGVWNTSATGNFLENNNTNSIDYEPSYFKQIGELTMDRESNILHDELGGYSPIALKTVGVFDGIRAVSRFEKKVYTENGESTESLLITDKIKREHREKRNSSISKLTVGDLKALGKTEFINQNSQDHHIGEIRVLKDGGATYIFGKTLYNTEKIESSFNVKGNESSSEPGTVVYTDTEDSVDNREGRDNFYNKEKTDPYAYSYLLTEVLSPDYEDRTMNGPTPDDLGTYTKFTYEKKYENYNWKVPFGNKKASFNEGFKSNHLDEKGNYVSGKKQIEYLKKIETKTHVAIFDLEPRFDAKGALGENSYALKSISLYNRKDYEKNGLDAYLIKKAHFKYVYELSGNVPNSVAPGTKGKLTLDKLYFTYGTSEMGAYTPYHFEYKSGATENPNYNLKAYDIWGNYRPYSGNSGIGITDEPTPQEFPYVQQESRALQDRYAGVWTLSKIKLPSGGEIDLTFESDDYQFVQDKKAMQMFKVIGAGRSFDPTSNELTNTNLFNSQTGPTNYLYVKLPDYDYSNIENQSDKIAYFKNNYLGEHYDKPIFFKFLLNMSKKAGFYDYVQGYFDIDKTKKINVKKLNGKYYA